MTNFSTAARKKAREDKFFNTALGITPKKQRGVKMANRSDGAANGCAHSAQLLEAVALLTAEIKTLNATMSKPRPKRRPLDFDKYLRDNP